MCALDAPAIDLTGAIERSRPIPTASRCRPRPAPTASCAASRCARARARHQLGGVRARQLRRRADRPADRRAALPHGRLRPVLARSRPVAHRHHHAVAGDRPERQDSTTADIFRITLDPGTVITYVAELRTDKLPQLYLWEPDAYKDKVNSFTLYYGIVIGIAGLLALFLTILFVVKGSVMFPAAAALGWAVLVYIGIDFGFWGKVFDMSAGAERVWRASRRGDPGGDAAGVPVRLSQSRRAGTCATRTSPSPGSSALAALVGGRAVRSLDRLRHRAHVACRHRGARPRPGDLSLHPRLRPRGAADPDLAPAGGLDRRRRRSPSPAASPTTSSARRCSAAWC